MIDDWYRTLKFPLPMDLWHRLPRSPAYKYEYIAGKAFISPRPACCDAVLDMAEFRNAGSAAEKVTVRKLKESDWKPLIKLMAIAFHRMPPFDTLTDKDRLAAARDCAGHTRRGGDGELVPEACMVAFAKASGDKPDLVGVALVTLRKGITTHGQMTPLLTWIFVHPWMTRRGIGGRLLSQVVHGLLPMGHRRLESVFLVGNSTSMLWHWQMGFQLVPMKERLEAHRSWVSE